MFKRPQKNFRTGVKGIGVGWFGLLGAAVLLAMIGGRPVAEPAACETVIVAEKPDWADLYDSLQLGVKGLSEEAFAYAWKGYEQLELSKPVLAIADFSQSSNNRRLYVIDMQEKKMMLQTYVAHGRNSGEEYAAHFSNRVGSYQSSLGFYKTLNAYQGSHGLSLRLEGLERGINDRARERAIVLHGAEYVSEQFIRTAGRLGRSQGCPAVPVEKVEPLIRLLVGGAGLFLYFPDPNYLEASVFSYEL